MTQRVGDAERRRLSALHGSGLLGADTDEAFDRLTRLAARLCDAPIARVSLVDVDRQVFAGAVGPLPPSGRQTPLSHAICKHVAYGGTELLIADASADARVAESGAVREHGVRAYAGEPLFSADGECLGALCVLDERPREWTEGQVAALRDLAAAANTEIRLRASLRAVEDAAERLAAQAQVLELTSDAVLIRRAEDDVVTFWNTGAERVYGLSAARALGRRSGELLSPDGSVAPHSIQDRLERDGRWIGELRRRMADGRELVVLSRQSLQRDRDGRLLAILQIDTDVTERKELEGRLRQAEKMEAMGQLAGGIAHDFNNLLTAISGYCALARETTAGSHEELDEIARAAERAGELTGKLLAFSRREDLRPTELDLDAVARELVPMLRRLIGEHVKIAVESGDRPARVLADRGQLEQVIVNLAVNARDAMPNGGTLTIETRVRERSGRFARPDGQSGEPDADVWLVIRDTGVGIAPDVAARVFEPFFTTKKAGNGTGLGLATVYAIVTQSGGEVRIDSRPGNGTSVTVSLPAARPAEPLAAPAEEVETDPFDGTETILLCEDEPAVQGLIERLLARHGYTVISAGHPSQALALAGAHSGHIDAVISDVVMPDMLGTELAVRLMADWPDLRILLISGYTAEALRESADFPAGSGFVAKPFRQAELLGGLRDLLDHPVRNAGAPRATE